MSMPTALLVVLAFAAYAEDPAEPLPCLPVEAGGVSAPCADSVEPASDDAGAQRAAQVEQTQWALDSLLAEHAGMMQALQEGGEFDSVFGAHELDADLAGDFGVLQSAEGATVGSGGLGYRGSGTGGGGSGGFGSPVSRGTIADSGRGGGQFGVKGHAVSLVLGAPKILGGLGREQIDGVVSTYMAQLRYCHVRALSKTPELEGKIVVVVNIEPDGSVDSAVTKSSTIGHAEMEDCVAGRFLRMRFPEPEGDGVVVFSYPLVFQAP